MENNQVIDNENQPIGKALTSFILSIVAVAFSSTGVLCVPGLVLGIVGLAFSKNSTFVTKKPFVVYRRIAYPMSIAAIVVGALFCTFWTGFFIYLACGGKIGNVAMFIL